MATNVRTELIRRLIRAAQINSISDPPDLTLDLMDVAVSRIIFEFFQKNYVFYPHRNTQEDPQGIPTRRYQICTIAPPLVTHSYLIISPWIIENKRDMDAMDALPDLIYDHLSASLLAPSGVQTYNVPPHWIILVTGTHAVRIRFFIYRPGVGDFEHRLTPVWWDETHGVFEEVTIFDSVDLINGGGVDEMLRQVATKLANWSIVRVLMPSLP